MTSSPLTFTAFVLLAALALASAVATVSFRNPIRSAVGLFVHVLALAGLYISLSAHFLTAVQLIVYVGAVVVLFVFVIMLLGPDAQGSSDERGVLTRAAGAGAMGLLGVFLALTVVRLNIQAPSRPATYGTIKDVGAWLFGPAVLPFEAASLLLTAAMVGAFAVARSNHKKVSMSGDAKLPAAKTAEGGEG